MTLSAFVGSWHRHVTGAEFQADGTGTYRTRAATLPDGRQVEEDRNLALTVGPTGSSLDATVISVRFVAVNGEGAESPAADPSPNESTTAGDTIRYSIEHPGVLHGVGIHGTHPELLEEHLCNDSASSEDAQVCGA
jgi:hypothetical protein